MPPLSQVTGRTLHLRGVAIGAGFYFEVEDRQYLVSARHVVGVCPQDLKFYGNGKWIDFPCELICEDVVLDFCVLLMPITFGVGASKICLSQADLIWGQPVWFLGFPYGDYFSHEIHLQGSRPHPYVKWGSVSAIMVGNETRLIAIDALNNVGFSGGPIGFTTLGGQQRVFGVMTHFKEETIFVENFGTAPVEKRQVVNQNAGLAYGTYVKEILELIEKNPFGRKVDLSNP